MRAIAERLQAFHIMIDHKYGLDLLEDNPLDQKQWSVFLKVDCGGKSCECPHRCIHFLHLSK